MKYQNMSVDDRIKITVKSKELQQREVPSVVRTSAIAAPGAFYS